MVLLSLISCLQMIISFLQESCSAIRVVLNEFCLLSRQIVSEAKSRVYFSTNVDRDTRESLCDILCFTSTPFLGNYLGFPLKQPGSSSQDYNFILIG